MSISVALSFQSIFAGDTARIGTAAGMQTVVPVGARYLAMAGANVASVTGIDGLHYNPASLAKMNGAAVASFSTMNILADIQVNYMALGFSMGDLGNLGVTMKFFDFGDIPLTSYQDYDGSNGRTFSPTFATIGLTYSAQLTDVIEFGITGKVITEEIDRVSANAFAMDIGIQYQNFAGFNGLSIGMVVKNIGTNLEYQGSGLRNKAREANAKFDRFKLDAATSDDLPTSFEIGVSYDMNINEENSIKFASTFNNYNFGSDELKFGGEFAWKDMLFARVGYLHSTDIDADDLLYSVTAGAGFKYNIGGSDITIDYSFRDSQYFDSNHLYSLKVGF